MALALHLHRAGYRSPPVASQLPTQAALVYRSDSRHARSGRFSNVASVLPSVRRVLKVGEVTPVPIPDTVDATLTMPWSRNSLADAIGIAR